MRLGWLVLVVGLVAVLVAPVAAQEVPPVGCPAGQHLDTGPVNDLRPPAGFCRCPDGEVTGFVATDGSGFHPQPSGDGVCAVVEAPVAEPEPVSPVVSPAVTAPDLEPLPVYSGRVLPRTG